MKTRGRGGLPGTMRGGFLEKAVLSVKEAGHSNGSDRRDCVRGPCRGGCGACTGLAPGPLAERVGPGRLLCRMGLFRVF